MLEDGVAVVALVGPAPSWPCARPAGRWPRCRHASVLRSGKSPAAGQDHRQAGGPWSFGLLGNGPESCPSPLFATRGHLLVGAHDGRIDHHVLVLEQVTHTSWLEPPLAYAAYSKYLRDVLLFSIFHGRVALKSW